MGNSEGTPSRMLPKAFRTSRFAALLAAALIGMAQGTGMAPLPPPIMFEQEIEWLSPDGDKEAQLPFDLSLDDGSDASTSEPGWIGSHLSRLLEGLRHRL